MTNLQLIKTYEGDDISALKIYHDEVHNLYKHRTHCATCGIPLSCVCYGKIENAIDAHDGVSYHCGRHLLALEWHDQEIWELIDRVASTTITDKIKQIESIQGGELFPDESLQSCMGREQQLFKECDQIVLALPDEHIESILSEMDFDVDMCGEPCEV